MARPAGSGLAFGLAETTDFSSPNFPQEGPKKAPSFINSHRCLLSCQRNMSVTTTAGTTANSTPAKPKVDAPFDPSRILNLDPYLEPFIPSLSQRYKTFEGWKNTIHEYEGGYDAFTRGYNKYGFTVAEDGTITYREWAPGAEEAVLIGDFSQSASLNAQNRILIRGVLQMIGTESHIP